MWIFLPGGLIMPSLAPMDEADETLTLGYRDIQVRARLREHLEHFIRDFMEPYGFEYSDIEMTPHMDYNCRFYTTKDELAKALALTVFDIDYRKFKPTAERLDAEGKPRYKSGSRYHGLLNSIWGSVLRLAPAGGSWGPRSKDNPNGYSSGGRKGNYGGSTGSSFGTRSDYPLFDELHDPEGWQVPDFESPEEAYVQELLTDLEGIPTDQWEDELTTEDYERVLPYKAEYHRDEKRRERQRRSIDKEIHKARKAAEAQATRPPKAITA